MTKSVSRIGIIVCSLMIIGAGMSVGQGGFVSPDKASSPPINQAGAFVYLIPQSAHSPGNLGSNWRTDAVLHNGGTAEATAWIYYLKADTDNSSAEGKKVTVAAHSSVKLLDLVKDLFGEEKSAGALLVGSDQELVITSRTYNDDPKGTFGQYVEGYPVPTAIAANEEVRLIGLAENLTRRTNLGFANAAGKSIDIRVAIYKADGTKLGEKTYQVKPYGFLKKDKILRLEFGFTNVDDAFAVISSSTPDAKYFTYASLTDNLSNDPVCIVPVGRTPQAQLAESVKTRSRNEPFAVDDLSASLLQDIQPVLFDKSFRTRTGDGWEAIGPWGGNVLSLAIDPANPQTIYAGTWGSGAFKCTNGGGSWTAINTGLASLYVSALAIDPSSSQTIYMGTGSHGVFKSRNGGGTWSPVNTGLANLPFITTLAMDPTSTQIIYAGTHAGVFKTVNGGGSWAVVNTGLSRRDVNALAIDPSSPQTVYVGTWGGGIFKSTNGGGTWVAANSGLPIRDAYFGVDVIAIDPSNPKIVYAGTGGEGIFKTMDGGGFWVAVNSGLPFESPSVRAVVSSLAIDPSNPQIIYAGFHGRGIFKSTNGGEEWTSACAGYPGLWVRTLAIDPTNPQIVFAGTRGSGVFRSYNGGVSWVNASTGLLVDHLVDTIAIDPVNPKNIYVATTFYGIYKSSDGGESWSEANYGMELGSSVISFAIAPANPQVIYAVYRYYCIEFSCWCELYKSTNGGVTWNVAGTGMGHGHNYVIAVDPYDPLVVYVGSNGGLFKTSDGGGSWTKVVAFNSDPVARTLAIDPRNPNTIYAGTESRGVFKSTDGGITWTKCNAGLTNLKIRALAIDPKNTQNVYAATYSGGLFKSTSGGGSWNAIGSLSKVYIETLTLDPNHPQTLYVGTFSHGVLRSADGGGSWTPVNTGLPSSDVVTFALDPIHSEIAYVGTWTGGLYKRTFAPCIYTLDPSSASFSRGSGTGSITVNTAADCPWTASSNDTWITITGGARGASNGAVTYSVSANTTGSVRSGTIAIEGQAFTVNQSACGIALAPSLSAPATAIGGQSYSLTWEATSSTNTYELQEASRSDFTDADTGSVGGTSATTSHIAITSTTFFSRVRAIDTCDGQTYVSPWSNPVQTVVTPASPTIYIPAAANVKGLVDTNWRTDLEVHNPGAVQSSFAVALLKKDQDNTTPTTKTFTLGSNQSVRYPNTLQNLFGFSGLASLCIIPTEGRLMATGRTYNLLDSGNKLRLPEGATFGQFIPGKPEIDAIQFGQTGKLIQLSQSIDETSGFRTNMGFTSVVAIPITIEIKLFKGDGTYLSTRTVDLAPFSFKQINTIFANVIDRTMDDGFAEVKTITPGGRFFAYASVTDNRSGDPIYIPAVVR